VTGCLELALPPPPRTSIFGLALISLHTSMCLAPLSGLKFRLHPEQFTMPKGTPLASLVGISSSVLPPPLAAEIACRSCWDCSLHFSEAAGAAFLPDPGPLPAFFALNSRRFFCASFSFTTRSPPPPPPSEGAVYLRRWWWWWWWCCCCCCCWWWWW
jgi:hypothetical protein